ncbi:hypothetical protein ABTE87_21270, partial [Acinetobacter baumannii]
LYACPIGKALSGEAVLWTMGWATTKNSQLGNEVTAALCVLFLCALCSGVWLARFLYQWSSKVTALEKAISVGEIENLHNLPAT